MKRMTRGVPSRTMVSSSESCTYDVYVLAKAGIFTGRADTTLSSKTPSGKIKERTGLLPSVSMASWVVMARGIWSQEIGKVNKASQPQRSFPTNTSTLQRTQQHVPGHVSDMEELRDCLNGILLRSEVPFCRLKLHALPFLDAPLRPLLKFTFLPFFLFLFSFLSSFVQPLK